MPGVEVEGLGPSRRGEELELDSGTRESEYFLCFKSFPGGWGFSPRMLTVREEDM